MADNLKPTSMAEWSVYLLLVDNSVENHQLFLDRSNAQIWSEIFQLRLNEFTEKCLHSP